MLNRSPRYLPSRREDEGFSLIELLVVIVVLGVLAGIAVLNLTGVAGKAQKATFQSDVATLNNASSLFFAEKGRSATGLPELVTANYLKPSSSVQGNFWIPPHDGTAIPYQIQFVPASPPTSGPGTNVGVCSAACASTPTAGLTGALNIGAATSLTAAFNTAKGLLQPTNPGLNITYTFGASGTVLTTITNNPGAFDVFASADIFTMNTAVAAGTVTGPVTFVKNKLIIAVAPGNPKSIQSINDLIRADVTVSFGGCTVPAGRYARQMLLNNGITAPSNCTAPISPDDIPVPPVPAPPVVGSIALANERFGTNVGAALANVQNGLADAALVYVTDVATANPAVGSVKIPDAQNVTPVYPIAVVANAPHPAAAAAFVQQAVSGDVQSTLLAYGFLPPT